MLADLIERMQLFRWRRRQMTSLPLRAYFAKHYNIRVGLYSYGCFDRWRMPGPLEIGRYCSFGGTVRVVGNNHPSHGVTTHPVIYDPAFKVVSENPLLQRVLVIEDNVWIGHNAIILPGCKFIGRGAIIGAGSVVTKSVARYDTVVGNPAAPRGMRFDPALIAALEASRWWELDMGDLANIERTFPNTVSNPTIENLARAF